MLKTNYVCVADLEMTHFPIHYSLDSHCSNNDHDARARLDISSLLLQSEATSNPTIPLVIRRKETRSQSFQYFMGLDFVHYACERTI